MFQLETNYRIWLSYLFMFSKIAQCFLPTFSNLWADINAGFNISFLVKVITSLFEYHFDTTPFYFFNFKLQFAFVSHTTFLKTMCNFMNIHLMSERYRKPWWYYVAFQSHLCLSPQVCFLFGCRIVLLGDFTVTLSIELCFVNESRTNRACYNPWFPGFPYPKKRGKE